MQRSTDGMRSGEPAAGGLAAGGLAAGGLARMHEVLAGHVERGSMPGLVGLVAHGGDVHVDVIGAKAFGDPQPLRHDDLFRIASLTKPITAVAAMTLVEDGTLDLEAPVDDLLPELADRRVLRSLDAELDDTVPAERSITVEDLLTFTMGFGTVMPPPGTYPVQAAADELELRTLGPPWPPTPHTPDQWIRNFGTLPLMAQPGERWMYNTGSQVLGVLLERAAGKPLDDLLTERIFEPLGMVDTAFSVPPEQLGRLTTAYAPDPETGSPTLVDAVEDSWWSRPPSFPDAGGGLISTIDDYWAFVEMMLGGGNNRGRRILSESTVALMTTDHLDDGQRSANTLFLGADGGWGLGLRVPAGRPGGGGGYGWDGGSGTTWRSDTSTGLTGILLTQRQLTSPQPPDVFVDFWTCASQALA